MDSALRPRLLGRALYWTGHSLFKIFFRAVWGLKVTGAEHVPLDGAVIFAANHASLADPPLVACSIPRMIHFMAKQELFDIPLFGWVIRQVNAFPIRRVERDVGAFKTAQRILSSGGALIVFPEGHRQKDGVLGRAKPGVGMLAVKANCRVVPVYVHNTHRFTSLARTRVSFGPPMSPEGETDYQKFSERVMSAIARLKEARRGS